MSEIINKLKVWQANSVVMQSVAHGFHWNVEGPLFTQYHELFGSIYEDVDGAIDSISEWMRKFGEYAPYTLQDFISTTSYSDVYLETNSPISMSRKLLEMNYVMISDLKYLFMIANQQNEQALANFVAERLDIHQKWNWFLNSTLKTTIN